MKTVLEVKTVDGEIHRHWVTEWDVVGGNVTSRDDTTRKCYLFAAGQWIYAKDVDPE